jgi:hypothetical protein
MTQAQLCGSYLKDNYLDKYKCEDPKDRKTWEIFKETDSGGMNS